MPNTLSKINQSAGSQCFYQKPSCKENQIFNIHKIREFCVHKFLNDLFNILDKRVLILIICIINFRLFLCIGMTLAIFWTERNVQSKKTYQKHHLIVKRYHFLSVLKLSQTCCLYQMIYGNQIKWRYYKRYFILSVGDKKNVFVFALYELLIFDFTFSDIEEK